MKKTKTAPPIKSPFPQEMWLPISRAKPYPKNPRVISESAIAKVAASIREFGPTQPIVLDEADEILIGHIRRLAALREGLETFPMLILTGLSPERKRALRIADNRTGEEAEWDMPLLSAEIADLRASGFDLGPLGFDLAELRGLEVTERESDPESVPEAPAKPVTRTGDVWQLGDHFLLCGDSTKPEDVQRLTGETRAALLFTSPPYAQQRDYGAAKSAVSDWLGLMQGVFGAAPVADGGQVLVNLGLIYRDGECVQYWSPWLDFMRAQGWRFFGWYVWDKLSGLPGDFQGRLAPAHEWLFHFNRKPLRPHKTKAKQAKSVEFNSRGSVLRRKDGKMSGVSNPSASMQTHKIPDSVFRVVPHKARGGANAVHPAMFPVKLAEEAVEAYSVAGDAIYEPFSGSGTTIIAAEKLGRACFALELDPVYVDVAVLRWQQFTGKKATLRDGGKTFEQTKKSRGKNEHK